MEGVSEMKFKDIPKFTRTPAQGTTIPLDYLKQRIEEHVSDMHLQLCPDFQRGHVWTTNQKIAYVEYLLRGGQSGRNIYFNHPGWMTSFKGDYVLVDGLQRITACLDFINGKIPVFGYYYNEFEDPLRFAGVDLIFYINNIKKRKDVLIWYLEMNSGGTPHTQSELDRVKKLLDDEK